MTDTSKPLTLREALEKILLHAKKLEDEIWSIGDTERETANKRIQEIIFQSTEAIKKWEDSSGKETGMRWVEIERFLKWMIKLNISKPYFEEGEYKWKQQADEAEFTTSGLIDFYKITSPLLDESVPPYKEEENKK